LGTFAYIAQIVSLKFIPISEQQAIYAIGPIWVGIFAYFILGEPYTCKEFFCALLSFCGILLVVRPGLGMENWFGKLIILLGSFFFKGLFIVMRYLKDKVTVLHNVVIPLNFILMQGLFKRQ